MTERKRGSGKEQGVHRDLFGQIVVSRLDVYAWLITVPGIDPASCRALRYVEDYGVIEKIEGVIVAGTFAGLTNAARETARYRELVGSGKAVASAKNIYALGEIEEEGGALQAPASLRINARGWKQSGDQIKVAKRQRKKMRESILTRMPSHIPSLSVLIASLGNPDPETLAKALRVSPSCARRWVREDKAPYAALVALFWLTRWGVSSIDTHAFNDALHAFHVAGLREQEAERLRNRLARMARLADFGSANDPLAEQAPPPAYPIPAHLQGAVPRAVPIVFESLRRTA